MADYTPDDETPETIANALRAILERGSDAQRQRTAALKAHAETLVDLDLALLQLGEEVPHVVRRAGAFES